LWLPLKGILTQNKITQELPNKCKKTNTRKDVKNCGKRRDLKAEREKNETISISSSTEE
jgi:hypothetical protein